MYQEVAILQDKEEDSYFVLGLLNSGVAAKYLEFLSPTINFQREDIVSVPLPYIPFPQVEIAEIAKQSWEISLDHWNNNELSFEFTHEIKENLLVREWISQTFEQRNLIAKSLEINQSRIDRILVDAYRLAMNIETEYVAIQSDLTGQLQDLFSIYVGCLLGRFSLDLPGFVLANQGESLADYLALVPEPSFMPDDDNVVPFTEGQWFEDDVVARFYEFLKVAFGEEHFSENVRFIEETLGKDIRKYFLTDFYTDHVKRYKTRPIYWMFSSPQGSFNALIYMHRYNSSTVGTVLKYVQEFVHKLRSQKEVEDRIAVSATNARDQAQAAKEAAKLQKMIVEVSEWERDVLYPLAQKQIKIDLDDGVKANYPKFGKALKQIKGLDKNDD